MYNKRTTSFDIVLSHEECDQFLSEFITSHVSFFEPNIYVYNSVTKQVNIDASSATASNTTFEMYSVYGVKTFILDVELEILD